MPKRKNNVGETRGGPASRTRRKTMDGTRHSDRPADNASGATRHESAAIGDKQGGDEGSAKELRQLVAQVLQAQKELNEAIGKLTANGAVASAGGEVNVKALGKAIAAQIAQPLADAIDGSVLSNLEPLVDGVSKMNQNVANKLGAMHKHVADVKRLARESASRSVQSQAMQTKIYQSIEGREEGGEIVGGLRSDVQGVIDGLAKKLNASSLIHGMRVSNPSSDHLASVGSAGTPNVAQNAETASDGGGSGSGAASDNDDGALGEGDHSAEEDGEDGEDPDEMRCHLALDKLTGVRVADFFDDFLDKNACDPRPIAYMSKVADRRDLDCEERISFYAKYNPNMLGSLGGDIKYDAALGWRCSALMGKFMIDFVRFKCDEDEAAKFDSLVNLYGLAKKDSVLRKALDVARRTFQKAYKSSVVNKYVDAAKGNGDADKQLIHELIYVARQAFARANPGKELEKANLSDWIRETLLGGDPARIDDAWVGSDELARKLRAEGGGEPEAAAEGSAQTPQSETAAQAPAAQESAATGAAAGPPAAGSPAAPPQ